MNIEALARIRVRPWTTLEAFQWHGEPVPEWEQTGEGEESRLVVPCYWGPQEAKLGDWISISPAGVPMVWTSEQFSQTYEVLPAASAAREAAQ